MSWSITFWYQFSNNYSNFGIFFHIPHEQVPVSKFHELRYNVAFILKEMEDLEQRNILKVQD